MGLCANAEQRRWNQRPEATISSDPEQLRTTVAALEQELERAHSRLRAGKEEIAELDRRKAEAAGSIAVAERAIDELEQRLVEQREALAHSEQVNEANRQLAARVGERDAAAGEVAHTIAQLLSGLDELAAARDAVAAAREAVRDVSGRSDIRDAPPEPEAFRANWERLVDRIRSDLGEELENDLVEAAARSPEGYAIKDLPVHLRVLATERRRALFKRRLEEDTTIPGSPAT